MFALIENNLVENIIIADQAFVDAQPGTYVDISAENPVPGIGWGYDGSVFSAPDSTVDPRTMEIVVTGISSDDPSELVQGQELTCVTGSVVTVNVEVRNSNNTLLDHTAMYRMPMVGPAHTSYVLANFVSGSATITTTLDQSGKWVVDESHINSAIPDPVDQFILQDDIVIYVLQ